MSLRNWEYVCKFCLHKWTGRRGRTPKICPTCKRPRAGMGKRSSSTFTVYAIADKKSRIVLYVGSSHRMDIRVSWHRCCQGPCRHYPQEDLLFVDCLKVRGRKRALRVEAQIIGLLSAVGQCEYNRNHAKKLLNEVTKRNKA